MATRFLKISSNGNKILKSKLMTVPSYMLIFNFSFLFSIVRLINLDFHKTVLVKYTFDNWASSKEDQAGYIPGSCDGFSDKFVFTIDCFAIKNKIGRKVEFCICFICNHKQYWDNNNEKNYIFQCFEAQKGKQTLPMPCQANPKKQVKQMEHFSILDDPWQLHI